MKVKTGVLIAAYDAAMAMANEYKTLPTMAAHGLARFIGALQKEYDSAVATRNKLIEAHGHDEPVTDKDGTVLKNEDGAPKTTGRKIVSTQEPDGFLRFAEEWKPVSELEVDAGDILVKISSFKDHPMNAAYLLGLGPFLSDD